MSYNFYFISGSRNPASLVQSLQQPAVQEPKPRPTLQLLDRPRPVINPPAGTSPEILPLTEANLAQGLTPAPRPRNMEILQQRATSVQGSVSRHSHKSQRSESRRRQRSRSPRRSSELGRNPPIQPPTDLPPGRWEQFPGIWNQPTVAVPIPNPPVQPMAPPMPPPLAPSLLPPPVRPAPAGQSPTDAQPSVPPFSVFPMVPGSQIVTRPPAPPSGPPVISLVNLADSSLTTAVTPNQTMIRAWMKSYLDKSFMLHETMINYVARMLDLSNYTTNDLLDIRLTKYDPKDHEQDPGERLPLYYYVIRVPGFRKRARIPETLPPPPQRANQSRGLQAIEHVMITHTSNPGGARGILNEAKIAPSRLHVEDSNSFFSLGARKTGDLEWDMKEFARIIHNTWYLSKQQCSLVFLGTAWGEATAIKEGGEYKCCELTKESGTVHHQRAKMWVTNTNSHILTGLAFPVTAVPPT